MILIDDEGGIVRLDSGKVGSGGEGGVFAVAGRPDVVAKIYHEPTPAREAKLAAMLAKPPRDPSTQHVSICWPQRLLYQQDSRRFAGFLMARVDLAGHVELLKLYNQVDREKVALAFNWRYLLSTAANIASVVDAIHARDYVIGDLNEGNFFVSNSTLAVLVDCDSMQVANPAGGCFRCLVGRPELAPPELHGRFGEIDLTPEQDRFTLGILLFRVLMESTHPFSGIWKGPGDDPPLERRIRDADCPYTGSRNVAPAPIAPPFDLLPPAVQALAVRCFGEGLKKPAARPAASEWRDTLRTLERNLKTCQVNRQHVYPEHRATCPWCERTALFGGKDPFPDPAAQQALRPVTFASPSRPAPPPAPHIAAGVARTPPAPARSPPARPATTAAVPAWSPVPPARRAGSPPAPAAQGSIRTRRRRPLLWLTLAVLAAVAGTSYWRSRMSPTPLSRPILAWAAGIDLRGTWALRYTDSTGCTYRNAYLIVDRRVTTSAYTGHLELTDCRGHRVYEEGRAAVTGSQVRITFASASGAPGWNGDRYDLTLMNASELRGTNRDTVGRGRNVLLRRVSARAAPEPLEAATSSSPPAPSAPFPGEAAEDSASPPPAVYVPDTAPPPEGALTAAPEQILQYRGTYVCAQGLTAMTLSIRGIGNTTQTGIMTFAPTAESRFRFAPGVYTVQGTFDPQSGELALQPVQWVQQPPGFIFLPMEGSSTDGGDTFTGRMVGGGCGAFRIFRVQR
jgi:hypothetical protein